MLPIIGPIVQGVTGLVNGLQTRSAINNAEKDQLAALLKAAGIVDEATGEVNESLLTAAMDAINGHTSASEQAATGVEGAVTQAQTGMDTAVGTANAGLRPYTTAGEEATNLALQRAQNPEQFVFNEDDPSFQWRLQQGEKALQRSAAAKGSALGGATLKSLARYSQGLASTEYAAAFDRFDRNRTSTDALINNLAGRGLTASAESGRNTMAGATFNGQIGMRGAETAGGLRVDAARYAGDTWVNTSRVVGDNNLSAAGYRADRSIDGGNVRAAAHMGRANAWTGVLNSVNGAGQNYISSRQPAAGGQRTGLRPY